MIGFYYRESNARSIKASDKLKELLRTSGLDFRDVSAENARFKDCSDIDLMIVFGGDGSVLRAAKIALDKFPIIAINTGNVGFLTSYEEQDLETLVNDIKTDGIRFSERRLMKVKCNGNSFYALNDAVVVKNYSLDNASECVKIRFSIDGEHVDTYVADGLIISTPTGSTAYALSAGAPIVTPSVDAFLAAPICAHTLHSRPIVFAANSKPVITVCENSKECALYVDGMFAEKIACGSSVEIERGDKCVRICDFADKFFNKLSLKLNIWSTSDGSKKGEDDE